jgi:ketosteroid isomerase-like protein
LDHRSPHCRQQGATAGNSSGKKHRDRRPRILSLIVRRVVQAGYAKQNRGDFEALARMFSADGVFEFQGDTPFGDERRGREAIRGWFDQVVREFGRLRLTADDVAVSGPPWNLRVIVRFSDRYELVSGDTLTNHGFQFLRLAGGKVKEDRILVDLGAVEQALEPIKSWKAERASRDAPNASEPGPRTDA